GSGLWLPEVGGLVWYVTFAVVCSRPSSGNDLTTQPAAWAALVRSVWLRTGSLTLEPAESDGDGPVPDELPPDETAITTATIAATPSSAPPASCRRRMRAAAARAA